MTVHPQIRLLSARVVRKFANLSIRIKIFLLFIILNIFSFLILYFLVYRSYYLATLKQTTFVTSQVLTSIDTNLGFITNEVFTLSLDIYGNKKLNDLSVDYYQNPTSRNFRTRYEIENTLKQFINYRQYIKSLRLYIQGDSFYAVQASHYLAMDTFMRSHWFRDTYAANGKMVFTPTYNQTYTISMRDLYRARIISFARAVKNMRQIYKDEKIGTLVVDLDETYLHNLFNRINLSKHNFIIISDRNGQILSATHNELTGLNIFRQKLFFNPLRRNSGALFLTVKGQKYLISFKRFHRLNWEILSYTPIRDLLLVSMTFNQSLLGFTLLCIVANLLLSFMITKIILNPIKQLKRAIQQIGNGNFASRIKVQNGDEIGEIGTQFNKMADNLDSLVKENYVIHLKEKEAQIKSLQAQINPHFLYNTLDTISWKVSLLGDEETNQIVSALGEILRYSINNFNKFVTLDQDLRQIENYLLIQKIRYEGRFQVFFHIAAATRELIINKLLIQPLVENAIQHGLENRERGGILGISAYLESQKLIIEIFDNGCGIPADLAARLLNGDAAPAGPSATNHLGINNVHQRVQLYYGASYGITIKSRPGKYTKISLRLPLLTEVPQS